MLVRLIDILPQALEQTQLKTQIVYDPVERTYSFNVSLIRPVTEWTDEYSEIVKDSLGDYFLGFVSFDVKNATLHSYTYTTYWVEDCDYIVNIQSMIFSAILLLSLKQSA